MTHRVPPLAVASIAAVLLVVVVGADLAINRSYVLEAQGVEDRWHVALDTLDRDRPYREPGVLQVNRSDPVTLRLTVDNEHPLALEQPYEIRLNGAVVGDGTLTAPAWSSGQATAEVDAARFFEQGGAPDAPMKVGFARFEVSLGDELHYGDLRAEEVAR